MTYQLTADFSIKPTLTGEKVVLRPFTTEDVPILRGALRDRELLKLTGSVHDRESDLAVVDRMSGRCVGEVVLNDWDEGNRSCNFRTFLAAAGQDRGLGTEALRLIVGYGFEQLGIHRISLEVYAFNPRARRVYEKAGFVAEGVLRQSLRYGGEWIDATVMSILAQEWAVHRGRP
jgi:RimJ/RimL family protein N-acetyltransferase